jgi:hypothetical protein
MSADLLGGSQHAGKAVSVIALIASILLFIAVILCLAGRERSRLVIGFTGSAFQEVTSTDIKAAVSVLIQKAAFKHFDQGEALYSRHPKHKHRTSAAQIATRIRP